MPRLPFQITPITCHMSDVYKAQQMRLQSNYVFKFVLKKTQYFNLWSDNHPCVDNCHFLYYSLCFLCWNWCHVCAAGWLSSFGCCCPRSSWRHCYPWPLSATYWLRPRGPWESWNPAAPPMRPRLTVSDVMAWNQQTCSLQPDILPKIRLWKDDPWI